MFQQREQNNIGSTSLPRESLSQLVSNLAIQSANLIRDELALAKRELAEKVQSVESILIMIALGAGLALVATLALCSAVILALSEYLKPWLSALIVGGVLGVIAGVMIAFGMSRLRQTSFKPEQTLKTLEENREWLEEIT